jgi:Na+/H+-translocating membrane pyrophosphatase
MSPKPIQKVIKLITGYSVGTASLACFLLFAAFIDEVNFISAVKLEHINIMIPEIFLAGLLGTTTVFLFTSWAIPGYSLVLWIPANAWSSACNASARLKC